MVKSKIIIIITLSVTALSVIIFSSVVLAAVSERKTHYFRRLLDNIIADNKNHYLSCDQLPNVEQVDKVVREHKDVVEQIIKKVGQRYHDSEVTPLWRYNTVTDGEDSYISFSWGESYPNCENTSKGDIEIMYSARRDRILIEKIINSDTFFGIPYNLTNV